jgi:hypothetical protein
LLLDSEDFEKYNDKKLAVQADGLVGYYQHGKRFKLHRQIAGSPAHVRFVNGNKLDCRRVNLESGSVPYLVGPDSILIGGESVAIDLEDHGRINGYRWRLQRGIPVATIDGKTTPLARLIINQAGGRLKYLDGNRLNCRRNNLSLC